MSQSKSRQESRRGKTEGDDRRSNGKKNATAPRDKKDVSPHDWVDRADERDKQQFHPKQGE